MRVKTFSPLQPNYFRPPRGEKQVYLPNFTLTLLRTPHAPPHFASFLTPLHLNKLDLKDYLWNAYGLQVLNVRSYVIQAKLRQVRGSTDPHRLYRPRASKKMTVELVQNAPGQGPFIWPDPPDDFKPWSKKTFDSAKKYQDAALDRQNPTANRKAPEDGKTIAEQAKALREGRVRWVPGWEDYGGARLVVRAGRGGGDGTGGQATEDGWAIGKCGRDD